MTISIRKAEKTDRLDWARMRHDLWDDLSIERHLSDIDKMLQSSKDSAYFALDRSGNPVGFAEISIRDYANGCTRQPVPFLEGIWIHADYRRSGVGRALLSRITDDLKAEGYVELCSDILQDNHTSHKAHENWGFEETERVIYFRKTLG